MRKAFEDMDAGEQLAEARRRQELRARGLPLDTPTTRLEDDDDSKEEKQLVHQLDKNLRALGWRVISYSQARETKQTPGIADRQYFHRARGVGFWWEAKTERGRQSGAQREFQLDVEAAGELYLLGPPRVVHAWLVDRGLCLLGPDGLLMSAPFVATDVIPEGAPFDPRPWIR